jgi:hypothetical protein
MNLFDLIKKNPSDTSYTDLFKKMFVKNNQELKDPEILKIYRALGFVWIRRPDFKGLDTFIRQPTVGFPVELYPWEFPGTYHIDSPRGYKLRTKICFFW